LQIEILEEGTVTSPRGFQAGVAACGLKKERAQDLALLYSEQASTAAGVFTTNQVAAAPVLLDREVLAGEGGNRERICGVVANAGNANACTGAPGLWAARQMQQSAAFALGCRPEQVLVLSTGVIGVQLPMPQINAGIDAAAKRLSAERGAAAAKAIMTTDTFPKQMALRVPLPDGVVTIAGMAKGAGMIHPNMATMLAVLTTDAAIAARPLQSMLSAAVDRSFNRISVDGDTSTNDTVLLLANGASNVAVSDEAAEADFMQGLNRLCVALAKMIVRDGEGASRFVHIRINGAATDEDARAVAATIATSPLVKTAFAGGDANWGRILAAAGRAGATFDQSQTALWIGNPGREALQLVEGGTPTAYDEAEATAIFAQTEIDIHLDLGAGEGEGTMWTCDLTHDYVTINAAYRT
jgi:glutamate N-acetyltransferase/amino-acid N-acetyltransferase